MFVGGQSLLFVLGGHCLQVVFVIHLSVGGCCSQVGDGSMVVVVHGGSSLSMGSFRHHGGSHRHGGFCLPWAVVVHGWLSSVGGHRSWVGWSLSVVDGGGVVVGSCSQGCSLSGKLLSMWHAWMCHVSGLVVMQFVGNGHHHRCHLHHPHMSSLTSFSVLSLSLVSLSAGV